VRILFITWDGPQVSYLETLFLPIFVRLKEFGFHFDVLQFRWGSKSAAARVKDLCEAHGIGYESVSIWRSFGGLGPFVSAVVGGYQVRRAVKRFASDAVMPRSLMPALAVLSARLARKHKIIFDSDGLAADERVDFAGLAQTSFTYRFLRDVEAQAVRVSAHTLVRSRKAAEILSHRAGPQVPLSSFSVVRNGRDAARFDLRDAGERSSVRSKLGIDPNAPLIVYAGSVGRQYRFDAIRELAEEVEHLCPQARLLILTGSLELAEEQMQGATALTPLVIKAPPDQVPEFLSAADLGIAFRIPSFSMHGVAPIKISEYLLGGLPVIGTASVGDTSAAVEAGVFYDPGDRMAAGAEWFVTQVMTAREEFRARSRQVGLEHFSLDRTVEDYLQVLGAETSNDQA